MRLPDVYLYEAGASYILQMATRRARLYSSGEDAIEVTEDGLEDCLSNCERLGLIVRIMGRPAPRMEEPPNDRQVCRITGG